VTSATDLVAEVLVHSAIVAAVVQLVVRRVPVTSPSARLRYRVVTLVLPIATVPLYHLLAPGRLEPAFADIALFSTRQWTRLDVLGVTVRDLAMAPAIVLGSLLMLRDAFRALAHWRHDRAWRDARRGDETSRGRLEREVWSLAASLRVPPPRVHLVDTTAAVLHCHGLWRPTLVVGCEFTGRLSDAQLQAALAHELAHLRHRDLAMSWMLMVLRVAQWFNPVGQVIARRAIQEMEWRADDTAVAATGQPAALARALLASARRGGEMEFMGVLRGSRTGAIEERCRRLIDRSRGGAAPAEWIPWDAAASAGGLALLLYFVV
jgi:Zn-dependent protease with chaperone function